MGFRMRLAIVAILICVALGAGAAIVAWLPGGDVNNGSLTYTVVSSDLIISVTEQGSLESANNLEIKCRVPGGSTILKIVEHGASVQAGDELATFDKSKIEESISQLTIGYENAVAAVVQAQSEVNKADISITEYEQATYVSELKTKEKEVVVARRRLEQAQDVVRYSTKLAMRGLITSQQLSSDQFAEKEAELDLEIKLAALDGLKRFNREKMLQELRSNLSAAEAKLASSKAALELEKSRVDRAREQLDNCVILAERSGLVLRPQAPEWAEQPDIEEGASVYEQQLLLVMPDMEQLQVVVYVHEAYVKRLRAGAKAVVNVQGRVVEGKVTEVATAADPAGWWNGNAVKYRTVVSFDNVAGLKPGMSADVDIRLVELTNILKLPVASVIQIDGDYFCFVKNSNLEPEKRAVQLGASNHKFVEVRAGLTSGDEVLLNARKFADANESIVFDRIIDNAGQTSPEQTQADEEANMEFTSADLAP